MIDSKLLLRRANLVAVALTLTACVSITEPVPMGKDTYMIALGAHGGFSTNAELLTESVKKASEFCAQRGLNVDVASAESTGVQGWTPQENRVVFRCLAASDGGYARPNFKPKPDIVIENKND